ncbi:hypothetical protein F511_11222 [Dorcoceras hygrometricum]|uniref:DUF4219 domain-containing protein n=1 Tax=Dorcoceras hygrometricum TaxID=472368 RepID=A0A2Z7CA72_9LAMI|nr:hypothetical protein F511_11222 [Dorcoceras hygrometricum]
MSTSQNKIPLFSREDYDDWKIRMQAHLADMDDEMWTVITEGPLKIMKPNLAFAVTNGEPQFVEKARHEYTNEESQLGQCGQGHPIQDTGQGQKHLIMQHAIINDMKCMRAIKDRIARPVYQLAIISIEPLYHAQQVSRWKSSVRDLQDPSAHHSSVVFRHDKSVGHHSDDSVAHFRHDKSVGQSQRGSQLGHQSICQAQYVCMNADQ